MQYSHAAGVAAGVTCIMKEHSPVTDDMPPPSYVDSSNSKTQRQQTQTHVLPEGRCQTKPTNTRDRDGLDCTPSIRRRYVMGILIICLFPKCSLRRTSIVQFTRLLKAVRRVKCYVDLICF